MENIKEKPTPLGLRVYKKHRTIIKKLAKKWKRSESAVVREIIEDMARPLVL